MTGPEALSGSIKQWARSLGFQFCGISPIIAAPHAEFFRLWLEGGRAGCMGYLTRNVDRRCDPRLMDTEAPASLIVLGEAYDPRALDEATSNDPRRGVIAAYAWSDDYHNAIRPRLYQLDERIRSVSGRKTLGKCLVDTGPVLERDWAAQAGVGFIGKNCCTITHEHGSWVLLATIIVPEVLRYDSPVHLFTSAPARSVMAGLPADGHFGFCGSDTAVRGHPPRRGTCGRCSRCLRACPTDAFVGPFHLAPERCVSYWTIEAKTAIPRRLRPSFGNRIFGCDVCQRVCPWNIASSRRLPREADGRPVGDRCAPLLLDGFRAASPYWLNEAAFREKFRTSAIKRTGRARMLRNVCVALGNYGGGDTVAALSLALVDEDPLARGHAAWALGNVWRRSRSVQSAALLRGASERELDSNVREEIQLARADRATD